MARGSTHESTEPLMRLVARLHDRGVTRRKVPDAPTGLDRPSFLLLAKQLHNIQAEISLPVRSCHPRYTTDEVTSANYYLLRPSESALKLCEREGGVLFSVRTGYYASSTEHDLSRPQLGNPGP